MKVYPENPLTFRSLYGSPVLNVRDYRCRIGRGGPAAEEHSSINGIVLMRHGAFCKHFGRRNVTADVNQAVFFSKGSTYRVSHPADCGDRGAVFVPAPAVLNDIIREFDPTIDDHPEQPFAFVTSPCDSGVFWRQYELLQRVAHYYSGDMTGAARACTEAAHLAQTVGNFYLAVVATTYHAHALMCQGQLRQASRGCWRINLFCVSSFLLLFAETSEELEK